MDYVVNQLRLENRRKKSKEESKELEVSKKLKLLWLEERKSEECEELSFLAVLL